MWRKAYAFKIFGNCSDSQCEGEQFCQASRLSVADVDWLVVERAEDSVESL